MRRNNCETARSCDSHLVYATDGAQSRSPTSSRRTDVRAEFRKVRRTEALAAAARLEVSQHRVHFLDFPEGELFPN